MFFLYFLCLPALVMKTTDLATPKRQKMSDCEPRAGESNKKWVKSREMSQIS